MVFLTCFFHDFFHYTRRTIPYKTRFTDTQDQFSRLPVHLCPDKCSIMCHLINLHTMPMLLLFVHPIYLKHLLRPCEEDSVSKMTTKHPSICISRHKLQDQHLAYSERCIALICFWSIERFYFQTISTCTYIQNMDKTRRWSTC